MFRSFTVAIALVAAMIVGSTPAAAITDGTPDGDGHPYVGLITFELEDGIFRCSGTLIAPQLFVTAGHCTFGIVEEGLLGGKVQLWFASSVEEHRCRLPQGVDLSVENCEAYTVDWNGYPLVGEVSGTAYPHEDYDDTRFFLRDLGVVVLDEPVELAEYAELPEADQSDSLKPSRHTRFTAVGYGLQKAYPTAAAFLTKGVRTRMVANPYLVQINVPGFTGNFALLLSNNAYSGGTCFGDSGGPNFYAGTTTIAAVTSFGLNSTCGGTGGVYRLDRDWNLDWIYDNFGSYLD